jgi:large subunit ribosomal protein L19e
MSIKLTKRLASSILGRGESSIRIRQGAYEEARKAMTRDDVRKLIGSGEIFALKKKSEVYKKAKPLKRKRGAGKRKGTRKARQGILWSKKVRSQRLLLSRLRETGKIDRRVFRRYYRLVKGNSFPDKRSLLLHLGDEGVAVSEDELKQINDYVRKLYK